MQREGEKKKKGLCQILFTGTEFPTVASPQLATAVGLQHHMLPGKANSFRPIFSGEIKIFNIVTVFQDCSLWRYPKIYLAFADCLFLS